MSSDGAEQGGDLPGSSDQESEDGRLDEADIGLRWQQRMGHQEAWSDDSRFERLTSTKPPALSEDPY